MNGAKSVNAMNSNRREFLSVCASAVAGASALSAIPLNSRATLAPAQREFLYGASVYPELQTREEWNRMLDEFRSAHMNVVRVAESSWGNLEIAPGKFNFGWLKDFLDDLQTHHMKAVLGTSTYLAPQSLIASPPHMLPEIQHSLKLHPLRPSPPPTPH